jgi:hypothetical protein
VETSQGFGRVLFEGEDLGEFPYQLSVWTSSLGRQETTGVVRDHISGPLWEVIGKQVTLRLEDGNECRIVIHEAVEAGYAFHGSAPLAPSL